MTNGSEQILIAARDGRCCRFNETDVRPMGRNATGVRGINIENTDEVIGAINYNPAAEDAQDHTVLVVSEHGFGKRTDFDEYRITKRGGKGVKTINITDKTGKLIAIKNVTENDDLMIINKSGLTIRMAVRHPRGWKGDAGSYADQHQGRRFHRFGLHGGEKRRGRRIA